MSSAPKKQLGLVDSASLPAGAVRLGRLPDPLANDKRERIHDLYAIEGLFVDHREVRLKPSGEVKIVDQFEMPLDGVRWVIKTIEEAFERKPSQGGLPRDKFHTDATIQGEHLHLRWGVSVGGEGVGGYTINNFSRIEYILNDDEAQDLRFTLDLWREHVRELFNGIAERHEAGEFSATPSAGDSGEPNAEPQ